METEHMVVHAGTHSLENTVKKVSANFTCSLNRGFAVRIKRVVRMITASLVFRPDSYIACHMNQV